MSKGKKLGYYAYKAYQGVRYLKGLVNAELHKSDQVASAFSVTQSGVIVQQLSQIAQGDTDSTRTGNSIFCRSTDMRGILRINGMGVASIVRIMMFIDLQQVDDTVPTVTQVLDTASVNSPLNNATVGRFSVLYDRKYTLTAVRNPIIPVRIYRKMRHHIRFNGANATDYQKGCIWVLVITDDAANPTFEFSSRTNFYDN